MKTTITGFGVFIIWMSGTGCFSTTPVQQLTNNSGPVDIPFYKEKTFSDTFISSLLAKYPQYFDSIVAAKDKLNVQILYTRIDRGKKATSKVQFTEELFNVDPGHYFYPASTVKLPVAVLALQKLNELNISGLDRNTTMITGSVGEHQTAVSNDTSAADGRPSIAHYIKKILLVSDNDAFNRLYEFLGQDYINANLHRMGYTDAQIIHRLSISLSEEENRLTNPIVFLDSSGKTIYSKPLERSQLLYAERDTRLGNGYMKGEELVQEPFDFSKKNRLSLPDLTHILRSIIFPADVPKEQRFNLTKDDYDFLRRYMSMRPGESVSPVYPEPEYWDNYIKMLYYGNKKKTPEPGIRIFNKTGTAYGFLIDACYFADFNNNIEFMLSAEIYCNSDGIFNDDKYDYDSLGYPFLEHLGRVIYDHELKRKRKYPARLEEFKFQY
jgi:hypothetical protein